MLCTRVLPSTQTQSDAENTGIATQTERQVFYENPDVKAEAEEASERHEEWLQNKFMRKMESDADFLAQALTDEFESEDETVPDLIRQALRMAAEASMMKYGEDQRQAIKVVGDKMVDAVYAMVWTCVNDQLKQEEAEAE